MSHASALTKTPLAPPLLLLRFGASSCPTADRVIFSTF